MATHDGQTVTIDYAGNTTADPAENVSFVYGDHNRMEEAYVSAVLQAGYIYNGQGQRTKKVEATGDERTFVFHYGLGGELLGETVYDEYGAKIGERDYIWLDLLPIAQSEREFSGMSVTVSSFVYIHADQLTTPRLASDSSQDVVWRWDSDAFGVGDADLDPDSDTNEVNVRLRFPGQYLDEETGLHYNYFRDYDPVTGRYVESDPIGLRGGPSTYGYVLGNPITIIDVAGLAGCYVNFPWYRVNVPGTAMKVPAVHAGVLSFDDLGRTRYYEYGRYDSDYGEVRRRTVPDLEIGPDGNPTAQSWNKLLERLKEIGHGTTPKTTCDAGADASAINLFAETRRQDPNRQPYSWNPLNFNTCTTFARDAFSSGRR